MLALMKTNKHHSNSTKHRQQEEKCNTDHTKRHASQQPLTHDRPPRKDVTKRSSVADFSSMTTFYDLAWSSQEASLRTQHFEWTH